MFERFDSLCLRDWCVINWISIWIYISRIMWFIHSAIILRLFLLSATSSLASPVHSYGGDARGGYFFTFLLPRLFSLLIIVSRLFRWAEMSHITTTGSYYSTSLFFTSFFMMSLLSLFPNKIETIFSFSYLSHQLGLSCNPTRSWPGFIVLRQCLYPVWRRGQRAWLITTRSQDRNL